MKSRHVVVVVAVALTGAACRPDDVPETPAFDSVQASALGISATPGTYTLDEFRRLHWLDGRWRGFMADGSSFYEQYRVVNDSTIEMTSHADSTYGPSNDGSRIALRGGKVTSEGGASQYVATRLDSTGVDFIPIKGRNAFTWVRESDTRWTATLRFTDADGRPQTVVYAMHRFGR